jgi:uncharacterized membrane protein YebE (DUF533 family)
MINAQHLLGALLGSGIRRPGVFGSMAGTGGGLGGLGGLLGGLMGGGLMGGGLLSGGRARGAGMAMLAGLAMKALTRYADRRGEAVPPAARQAADISIRDDEAILLIRAMIAAAQADGVIDAEERQRLLAKLKEIGASQEEWDFLEREITSPKALDVLLREVNDPELGERFYAASLAAIRADTQAEQSYLHYLADRLGLAPDRVEELHRDIGAAA